MEVRGKCSKLLRVMQLKGEAQLLVFQTSRMLFKFFYKCRLYILHPEFQFRQRFLNYGLGGKKELQEIMAIFYDLLKGI